MSCWREIIKNSVPQNTTEISKPFFRLVWLKHAICTQFLYVICSKLCDGWCEHSFLKLTTVIIYNQKDTALLMIRVNKWYNMYTVLTEIYGRAPHVKAHLCNLLVPLFAKKCNVFLQPYLSWWIFAWGPSCLGSCCSQSRMAIYSIHQMQASLGIRIYYGFYEKITQNTNQIILKEQWRDMDHTTPHLYE